MQSEKRADTRISQGNVYNTPETNGPPMRTTTCESKSVSGEYGLVIEVALLTPDRLVRSWKWRLGRGHLDRYQHCVRPFHVIDSSLLCDVDLELMAQSSDRANRDCPRRCRPAIRGVPNISQQSRHFQRRGR